jgi:hypothetical protein
VPIGLVKRRLCICFIQKHVIYPPFQPKLAEELEAYYNPIAMLQELNLHLSHDLFDT